MRYWICLFCCFVMVSINFAQEDLSPYDIALQRILEAEASGASRLDLANLGLTELPPEIGSLSSLQILYLYGNHLASLPPEIGNLSALQELSVNGNHLASIPPEIGNLSNLQGLNLSGNQLSNLPPEIGNLSKLEWLELAGNQLTNLPPEIGHLGKLCWLNLRGNQFQNIPFEIHSLKRLGSSSDCAEFSRSGVLLVDETLLEKVPQEVLAGGTPALLDYLENEAAWHLRRLIISAATSTGLLALVILGLRWRYQRGKRKRKNAEKAPA